MPAPHVQPALVGQEAVAFGDGVVMNAEVHREQENIYSKELLSKHEILGGPVLASSIKSLKRSQILDEGTAKGKVIFDDPLFAIWLRNEFDGDRNGTDETPT